MGDEIYGPPAPGSTVTANTGKNDPNGIWAQLGSALTTGAGLYNSIANKPNANSNKTSAPPAPAAPAASGFDWKKWLPYIAGAAAVITILSFLLHRK